MSMRTCHGHIQQNEILWITPEVCCLPELPRGFALRVDDFLGWDRSRGEQPRRVWVRGPVLLDADGTALRTLTLCVPVDQPRAVLGSRAPAPAAPRQPGPVEPTRAVGVASIDSDAPRVDERGVINYAGRLYRRVEVADR